MRVVVTKGEKSLKIGTFRVDHWFSLLLHDDFDVEAKKAGAFIFHLTAFLPEVSKGIIRVYSLPGDRLGS